MQAPASCSGKNTLSLEKEALMRINGQGKRQKKKSG
jgi:hypothetical protein